MRDNTLRLPSFEQRSLQPWMLAPAGAQPEAVAEAGEQESILSPYVLSRALCPCSSLSQLVSGRTLCSRQLISAGKSSSYVCCDVTFTDLRGTGQLYCTASPCDVQDLKGVHQPMHVSQAASGPSPSCQSPGSRHLLPQQAAPSTLMRPARPCNRPWSHGGLPARWRTLLAPPRQPPLTHLRQARLLMQRGLLKPRQRRQDISLERGRGCTLWPSGTGGTCAKRRLRAGRLKRYRRCRP